MAVLIRQSITAGRCWKLLPATLSAQLTIFVTDFFHATMQIRGAVKRLFFSLVECTLDDITFQSLYNFAKIQLKIYRFTEKGKDTMSNRVVRVMEEITSNNKKV